MGYMAKIVMYSMNKNMNENEGNSIYDTRGNLKDGEHYLDSIVRNLDKIYPNAIITTPTKFIIGERDNNIINFKFEIKNHGDIHLIKGGFIFKTVTEASNLYRLILNGRDFY